MLKMINRAKNKKKGFTLIELIVVIAILGILAAILVPSMMGVVSDSRKAVKQANARSVYSIAQSVYVSTISAGGTVATGTYASNAATPDAIIGKINTALGSSVSDNYSVTVGTNGITSVTILGATTADDVTYPTPAS